ncbi:DNA polymerase IIIc chi subunit [Mycetocola sp. BIGb0189]|uniref:hypothetical protein n=1 Tax=Mycetocola sp. BIGb0189 TaxID=2940604 RepID=UPI002167EA05|nr:hypothetical protein [Mycetocola sp. BIGb0189]MCS4275149.1 DNA polymerase IIIc chi subunit [Mycetocola sp. BIGb0189]
MDIRINDAQRRVLQWVAEGADLDNPPSGTFKTSAPALHTRGLVKLDKRRGHWSVEITEAGKFYLEHGHYPDSPAPKLPDPTPPLPPSSPKPADASSSAPPQKPAVEPDVSAKSERVIKDEKIPMPDQVRRPHKAVKELVDHKARLDVPIEQRQRALLILHALAQESIRRGWKVIANPSTFETDPWNGRKKRVSPGPDLFSIDAGDSAAAIRLRMQQKRVDHVPTEKELADEARYKWRSYPKHDYVPTERMRLEIRSSSHDALTLDDTVATRIEDKLLRAIVRIEQMSVDARDAAERRRQWEIQRAEEQRLAEELRKRAARYSSWAETLEQLRTDFIRHRELAEAVADLREAADRRGSEHEYAEALADYLSWSELHLQESDPLRRIWLPQGERPDLSYDEWQEWQRRSPKRNW